MSSMDEREKALENRYAHDTQIDFNTEARCCKLFGLWVAEQLGLEGADATTYAASVVEANLEEAGFDDVLRKVKPDIEAKGLDISDHMRNTQIDKALAEARRQIMAESNSN